MNCAASPSHALWQTPAPASAGQGRRAAETLFTFLAALFAWLRRLSPAERLRASAVTLLDLIQPCLFDLETFTLADDLDINDRRKVTLMLDDVDAYVSAHIWMLARERAGLRHRLAMRPLRRFVASPLSTEGLALRWGQLRSRLRRAEVLASRLAGRLAGTAVLEWLPEPANSAPSSAIAKPSGATPALPPQYALGSAAGLHLLSRALAILRSTLITPSNSIALPVV